MKTTIKVKKTMRLGYQITISAQDASCCFWSQEKPAIEYTEEKGVTA